MTATDLRQTDEGMYAHDCWVADRVIKGSKSLHAALWAEHPKRMRIAFTFGLAVPPPSLKHNEPAFAYASGSFIKRTPETGAALIQAVSDLFGVSYGEAIGDARGRVFVEVRAVVIAVLRERGWSYPRIGKLLNNRDHSTIIHSHRTFDIHAKRNPLVNTAFHKFRPDTVRAIAR